MATRQNSNSKQNTENSWDFGKLILPLVCLLILGALVFVERIGLSYNISDIDTNFLPQSGITNINTAIFNDEIEAMILYDSEDENSTALLKNIEFVFDEMSVGYRKFNINEASNLNFRAYDNVVVTFSDVAKLTNYSNSLFGFIKEGGGAFFAISLQTGEFLSANYRNFGMTEAPTKFITAENMYFSDNILFGAEDMTFGSEVIYDTVLDVDLHEDTDVHVNTDDEFEVPLLWDFDLGDGKVAVYNGTILKEKASRGLLFASYNLLNDVYVYPVINAASWQIDDFPAPLPAGYNDLILEQYGVNNETFFTNIWWPDMQKIAQDYGLKYSSFLIETYNDVVSAPFPQGVEDERSQYFGGSLLSMGGEIGFHGYNHMPYALSNFVYKNKNLGYSYWESKEAMATSMKEVYRYGKSLFPDNEYTTYVPPSNIISKEGIETMVETIPSIRVIASLYLVNETEDSYKQEFDESENGIINVPRVTSGFLFNDYMKWAFVNEASYHLVISHFVHPDDVLDNARGAEYGWDKLRENYLNVVKWADTTFPAMRKLTTRETAAAVQRFSRVNVSSSYVEASNKESAVFKIKLGNFYDEASLLVKLPEEPTKVNGATIIALDDDRYLLYATKNYVTIEFGDIM